MNRFVEGPIRRSVGKQAVVGKCLNDRTFQCADQEPVFGTQTGKAAMQVCLN